MPSAKAEKAEARRIAVQLAEELSRAQADLAGDDEEEAMLDAADADVGTGEVTWGQPNPNFRMDPGTVEDVLWMVKQNLTLSDQSKKEYMPFWYSSRWVKEKDLENLFWTNRYMRADLALHGEEGINQSSRPARGQFERIAIVKRLSVSRRNEVS